MNRDGYDSMTYQACPDCFTKLSPDNICRKCSSSKSEFHTYFFRINFQDGSDILQIGFARGAAETLMEIPANDFVKLKDKQRYVKENVLFREFKVALKTKEETFKGEIYQRFYAIELEYVGDCDSQT